MYWFLQEQFKDNYMIIWYENVSGMTYEEVSEVRHSLNNKRQRAVGTVMLKEDDIAWGALSASANYISAELHNLPT